MSAARAVLTMSVISVMVFCSTAAVGEIAAEEFAPEFACSMQHDEGSGTGIETTSPECVVAAINRVISPIGLICG